MTQASRTVKKPIQTTAAYCCYYLAAATTIPDHKFSTSTDSVPWVHPAETGKQQNQSRNPLILLPSAAATSQQRTCAAIKLPLLRLLSTITTTTTTATTATTTTITTLHPTTTHQERPAETAGATLQTTRQIRCTAPTTAYSCCISNLPNGRHQLFRISGFS